MNELGVYVDFRGELVRKTPAKLERDFCRRILTSLFLCLRGTLPKDVIKMIGKMVERDYKMDNVWEFLINQKQDLDTLAFLVDYPKKYEEAYGFLKTENFGLAYRIPNKEEIIWFAFVNYYPNASSTTFNNSVKTIVFNKYKK
jgi:hypothetical protein